MYLKMCDALMKSVALHKKEKGLEYMQFQAKEKSFPALSCLFTYRSCAIGHLKKDKSATFIKKRATKHLNVLAADNIFL